MSLALSSVRDLTPAVFKDVEYFFCKVGRLSGLDTTFPFLLEPFGLLSKKEFLLEAWAISEYEEGSRDAVIGL